MIRCIKVIHLTIDTLVRNVNIALKENKRIMEASMNTYLTTYLQHTYCCNKKALHFCVGCFCLGNVRFGVLQK